MGHIKIIIKNNNILTIVGMRVILFQPRHAENHIKLSHLRYKVLKKNLVIAQLQQYLSHINN